MISDARLKELRSKDSKRLAEIRKVESAIDTCIVWLKLYTREGNIVDFDRLEEDLTQALVELWQLAAIHD